MKKWVKISLVLFFFSACCGGYFGYKHFHTDKETNAPVIQTQTVVKDRFYGLTPAHSTGVGHSMEPTLTDGQTYEIYKVEPQAGDIVVFNCTKSINEPDTGQLIAKRLVKIREDGAWWVEGDNHEHSYDSNDYGWILPSERSNVWVVKVN